MMKIYKDILFIKKQMELEEDVIFVSPKIDMKNLNRLAEQHGYIVEVATINTSCISHTYMNYKQENVLLLLKCNSKIILKERKSQVLATEYYIANKNILINEKEEAFEVLMPNGSKFIEYLLENKVNEDIRIEAVVNE